MNIPTFTKFLAFSVSWSNVKAKAMRPPIIPDNNGSRYHQSETQTSFSPKGYLQYGQIARPLSSNSGLTSF